MSTVVYQNIHSYFETQLFEPRSLSLKLNPPKPSVSDSTTTGWGCIQDLSNTSSVHKEATDKPEVYVHPLVKRSASMLSEKSLEMCTENLGSETGTDITEDGIFSIPSLDSDAEESTVARERRRFQPMIGARKAGYESLPPPLTTICGANLIRVQPHRESGRLVMNAVSTSLRRPSIHAERSNGRLTMSLLEDFTQDSEGLEDANEEARWGECEEEREKSDVEEEEEEIAEEEEEDVELIGVCLEEGKDGINVEVGGKFGIGEFQRPSRCKEGGRGTRRLINWEQFCVAT